MKRDWREYNNQLVKRGELLISPQAFGFEEKHRQEKKRSRPYIIKGQTGKLKNLPHLLQFLSYVLGGKMGVSFGHPRAVVPHEFLNRVKVNP